MIHPFVDHLFMYAASKQMYTKDYFSRYLDKSMIFTRENLDKFFPGDLLVHNIGEGRKLSSFKI